MRQGVAGVPTITEWVVSQLSEQVPGGGGSLGLDLRFYSFAQWASLSASLQRANHSLVGPETNLVDAVWGSARPACPSSPLRTLDDYYTGRGWWDKVNQAISGTEHLLVVSELDDVAWLLNLRALEVRSAFDVCFLIYNDSY